jgi:hypothetical protein
MENKETAIILPESNESAEYRAIINLLLGNVN